MHFPAPWPGFAPKQGLTRDPESLCYFNRDVPCEMINHRPFESLANNFSNLIGFASLISAACVLLISLFIENICLSVSQPLGGKPSLGDLFALHSRGGTAALPRGVMVTPRVPVGGHSQVLGVTRCPQEPPRTQKEREGRGKTAIT